MTSAWSANAASRPRHGAWAQTPGDRRRQGDAYHRQLTQPGAPAQGKRNGKNGGRQDGVYNTEQPAVDGA